MKNFAVFVAFSLLVAFACGQFDHTPRTAAPISLGSSVTDANQVTTVTTGTAVNQTLRGCYSNTHAVNSVKVNNGPYNSGSYFQVAFKNTNGSLDFSFGTTGQVIPFEILRIEGGSPVTATVGTVSSGVDAKFFYYCHLYPSSTPLQVEVWSTSSDEYIGYDLTVVQYVSAIKTIPTSRTLASGSPGFLNLENATHIGGENFVHYYHKLAPTLAESANDGRLFVEVKNWNWQQATGRAKICVSFTGLVSFDGTGVSGTLYTVGDDTTSFIASSVENPTGCPILCTESDIISADSALLLPIDACDFGFCPYPEDIWIGILSPVPTNRSTYTVSLRFQEETIAEVGTIPAGNGHVQGTLTATCNSVNDCADYYEITAAPASTATKFGPFLSLELYAVNLGTAQLELREGELGGPAACGCGSPMTCAPSATVGDVGGVPLYCSLIIHPCQYNRTLKYTATVQGVTESAAPSRIEYALDTFVGSWPVETVSPSAFNKPSFGTVKPYHYQHYQVTFTQDQLTELSYFQVELYSLHEEDALKFFWRYGNPAGLDTECFGYDGLCTTNQVCGSHDDPLNTGHCRFLFLPCEIEETYQDYAAHAFVGAPTGSFDGLKVAQLKAGTYYFAVRGEAPAETNVKNEYTYTITWNIQEEIHIFDSVSIPNAVHFLDYSHQYVFTFPKLDPFYVLRIRTTYVFNGLVATFINCDAPAGTCPCGGHIDSCVAGLSDLATPAAQYECEMRFDPLCSGCQDKLYITVKGIDASDPLAAGLDAPKQTDTHKPIPYILTVIMEHVTEVPLPILTASRAGYYHADSIERAFDIWDVAEDIEEPRDEFRKYYKVSFANAEDYRNDMFFVDLTIIDGLLGMAPYHTYDGSPQASLQIDTFDDCRTHALCWVGTIPLESTNTLATFWKTAADISQGTCRAALQPCHASTTCTDSCVSAQAEQTDLSIPYLTQAFDRTRDYYIIVNNFGNPLWSFAYPQIYARIFENINNIFFHLRLQIVEQTPLQLSLDNAIYGHVGDKQYVHFRYDVASVPANSKLVFEVYRNHNEEEQLFFYVNHWDGTGSEVWAGEPNDCYAFAGCGGRCELNVAGDLDVCTYEVSPCDLKTHRGTYFLSVSSGTVDYVWTDSTYGLTDIDFTISAKHVAPIEILGGTEVEGVERGLLSAGSSLYYSVTVPRSSSGVLGRILTIELEDVRFGDVEVTISRDSPDNQCDCSARFTETILEGPPDRYIFKRYPCEVTDISTFYITVTGIPTSDCEPVGFVLRAFVNDIHELPITLTANTTTANFTNTWRYDSTAATEFTIDPREITVVTWTVNAPTASVMDIQITQGPTAQTIPVTLGAGDFSVPVSGVVNPFGPLPDTTSCSSGIASGSLIDTLALFVDTCLLPDGSTKYFLLFSGEDIATESGPISLSIRVIAPQSVVQVPAATVYGTAVTSTIPPPPVGEESVLGSRVVSTVSTLGLRAGETVFFDFSGTTVYISYNSEPRTKTASCPFVCSGSCTVEVCSDLTARTWYFGLDSQTTALSVSITRNPAPWNSTLSNLSPTTLTANAATPVTFDIVGAENWKYFQYRVPAATNGAFEVSTNGSLTVVLVDKPVYLPKYTATSPSGNILLSSDGTVNTAGTCGALPFSLPQTGTCCYEEQNVVFAVLGPVTDVSIELKTVSFVGVSSTVGFPTSSSVTVGQTAYKPSYFTFTVPEGTLGFVYQFNVTTVGGQVQIYLGKFRSGNGALLSGGPFDFTAPATDYSGCYDDSSIASCSISDTSGPCEEVFSDCESPCTGVWVLSVVPLVATPVTVSVVLEPVGKPVTLTSSLSGLVPPTANLAKFPGFNSDLYSEYVYTFNAVGLDTANWIPIDTDPLLSAPEYLPQRVVFQITNLRHNNIAANFTDAGAPQFTFVFGADECSTGTGLTCLTDAPPSTDSVLRCEVSYCALSCPQTLQIRAVKQDTSTTNWQYQLSATTAAATYDNKIAQQSVTVGASGTTVNYKSPTTTIPGAVYFKTTFNLPANSWVDIVVDQVNTTGAALTLKRFDPFLPSMCETYGAAVDLCTSITTGVECTVTATEDERCTQAFGDLNNFPVFYRVGFDSATTDPYNFRLRFIVHTTTPVVDASQTTLASEADSYSKVKDIEVGSWHFYQFNLRPTMGYDSFHLDITPFGCLATQLEVYTSFEEAALSDMEDFDRPNKWPVGVDCSARNEISVTTLTHFDVLGECHLYGGLYRVAIYAPAGSSLFDGFVTYSISASLMTNPHLDLDPYCPLTQVVNADFIPRFELLVEPSNRGSKLSFHASTNSDLVGFTLRVSKNANPYPTDTTLCGTWDATQEGNYEIALAPAGGPVNIPISECDFENDIWYIYIDAITGAVGTENITVWAEIVTQYIPVADLTGNVTSVSWSATLNGAPQTYKVIVDPTRAGFSMTPMLSASGCSAVTCTFNLVYSVGSTGFSSSSEPLTTQSCSSGCDVDCAPCSLPVPTGPICAVSATEYFFTVSTPDAGDCPYTFEITTMIEPTVLVSGDELCVSATLADVHYYSISSDLSTLTIQNPDLATIVVESQTTGCTFTTLSTCTLATCDIPLCGGALLKFTFAGTFVCGFDYGVSLEAFTATPITLGRPVAAGVALSSYTVTNTPVTFIGDGVLTYTSAAVLCALEVSCVGTNVLTAVGGESTTYYFENAEGLILTASSAARSLTTSSLTVTFDTSSTQHFVINIPAGVKEYVVEISDFSDNSASFGYEFSTTGLALSSCAVCPVNILPISSCGSFSVARTVTCGVSTEWLSISQCASTCEPVKFSIKIVYESTTQLPTISGNHNTAYTVLDNEAGCGAPVSSKSYVVEVTDILSVSLRNPLENAIVTIGPVCGGPSDGCGVLESDYALYSCQTGANCLPSFSCQAPGFYEVVVSTSGALSSYVEFLVVNQWVDLSGSATDSIIGAERHFYKVNAAGSLSVSLDIAYGPALKFFVFDGCDNLATGFSETQICIDQCHIWLPTKAKHSSKSTYYIEIESKTITSTPAHFAPNDNLQAEKATGYTITTKVGTANCGAPPSSGFCGSTSSEGVNVWSSITSTSVWSFVDPAGKDAEARCRFESMLGGCVSPSEECRSWLKVYSCLTSFPQCDASGFQTGICTDVCSKVVEVCGDVGLNCCSDQFVDSVEGSTCYDIPPPPPPATVSELPDLVGVDFEYPPSLDTPVFSTIQVYLPPASELFENIPLLKEAVVEQESSSAATLVPSFIFCLFLVIGLFF